LVLGGEKRPSPNCHRPAPVPDLIGDDRATQYAVTPALKLDAFGILGHPPSRVTTAVEV
jgi:hypothetical protein